jgi:tetratricopeptide (TPR) repeat protein
MDCHKTLVLALGLSASALGCVHNEVVSKQIMETTPRPAVADNVSLTAPGKDDKKPKRKPKPATLIAYGIMQERMAEEENRQANERDTMRTQAIKAYQHALEVEPGYRDAMLGLARVYENAGDHERAIQAFQAATVKHAKDAKVWNDLGMCHAKHKEWEPALESMRKAADLDRDNQQYAKTLGLCLARAGRYDESYECLKRVLGPAEAHFYLARMLKHMDYKEACMAQLHAALQVDPTLAKAHQMLEEIQTPVPQYLPSVQASYHDMELQ